MKALLIVFMMFGYQVACGAPGDTRQKLETVTGSDQSSAQRLLRAIESHSKEQVRAEMNDLVRGNKSHLVSVALVDRSDQVKLEAATALASVKKKSIALALLDASKQLEVAVRGGTEADTLRARTKQVFEDSLAAITGVAVQKAWSPEQKAKEFRKAAEKLPE